MTTVWDALRHYGVPPEADWAYPREQRDPVFDWDDYYAPIPQMIMDKAKRFTSEFFDIGYEWLVTGGSATQAQYKAWLRRGPIHVAGPICSPWGAGPVPACGAAVSHATMIYKVDTVLRDFDHYDPVHKALQLDYPLPWAIRGVMFAKGGLVASPLDLAFARGLAGKMLLNVDDRGSLWYVTPEGKRAKVGNKPEEVENFLQAVRDKRVPVIGINAQNISKIPIV